MAGCLRALSPASVPGPRPARQLRLGPENEYLALPQELGHHQSSPHQQRFAAMSVSTKTEKETHVMKGTQAWLARRAFSPQKR